MQIQKSLTRFVIGIWTCVSSVAHAAPDPQAILAASDAVRNPSRPFSVVLTLNEYRSR